MKHTLAAWLTDQILHEKTEKTNIKKIVVIYPGRFQPMGKHHAETFRLIVNKFPAADCYIATSNKVEVPKSPFSFAEKKKIISGYGIKNVVQVKSVYVATEILNKYNPETTAVIFVVGAKDMDDEPRFKIGQKKSGGDSFFQDYSTHKDNLQGFNTHGYLLTAPHISLNVPGYGEMSGTQIRKALGDPAIDDTNRKQLFKNIFGFDNRPIYDLVTNKLLSLNEIMESFVAHINYPRLVNTLKYKHLHEVSTSTGQGAAFVDDSAHCLSKHAAGFKRNADKLASRLGWEVVDYVIDGMTSNSDLLSGTDDVSFMETGVDKVTNNTDFKQMPGYAKWRNYIQHIASESGMEIKKFTMEMLNKPTNLSFGAVKLLELTTGIRPKMLLTCGGAYGHMSHPFDDNNLTFGDFKTIIRDALQGTAEFKTVTEKTDGQNIMITWKDGKLKAARNNGQIKNPISISELATMFNGRGDIKDAFVYAMIDLDAAISSLKDTERNRIFDNGNNFMNLEIIYPATKNVIDYDKAVLQFHGAIVYKAGQPVGEVKNSAAILNRMINKVNQSTQEHFNIIAPQLVTINKSLNFAENQAYFLGQLNRLQARFNLKDTDTIGKWHQSWWSEFISKKAYALQYPIPNNILDGLVNRWAFSDKTFDIKSMKNEITNTSFLNWATTFDRQEHKSQFKINIAPFEILMLELGAEVMKNAEGFLSASPDKTVQDIRRQLANTIRTIRSSGDLSSLEKMNVQLARIQAIGGFKQIVPAEGIVFKYMGNTYKFTGVFAPINALLGITRYSR